MGKKNKIKTEDREIVWDWLKHEDTLMFTRHNYYLIVTAIFLAAIIDIGSVDKPNMPLIYLLWTASVIVCLIWQFTIYTQLKYTVVPLSKLFLESKLFETYSNIHENRKKMQSVAGFIGGSVAIIMLVINTIALILISF